MRDASKLVQRVRQRVRELRLERGLTQEELCERARISVDAISRIESGSRVPTIETVERIASALGVTPSIFFEDEAPEPLATQPESLRRVVTLLQLHPEPVLILAENVVTALVRAYRRGTESGRAEPRLKKAGRQKKRPSSRGKRGK